jgi:hypothetical protein
MNFESISSGTILKETNDCQNTIQALVILQDKYFKAKTLAMSPKSGHNPHLSATILVMKKKITH